MSFVEVVPSFHLDVTISFRFDRIFFFDMSNLEFCQPKGFVLGYIKDLRTLNDFVCEHVELSVERGYICTQEHFHGLGGFQDAVVATTLVSLD